MKKRNDGMAQRCAVVFLCLNLKQDGCVEAVFGHYIKKRLSFLPSLDTLNGCSGHFSLKFKFA
jgi:hypothetical protein